MAAKGERASLQPWARRWVGVGLGAATWLLAELGFCATEPSLSIRLVPQVVMVPQIQLTAASGSTNRIEVATNLNGTTQWVPLTNLVMGASNYVYTEPVRLAVEQRFYRVVPVTGSTPWPPVLANTNLLWLPPGQFVLGSSDWDPDYFDNEVPSTQVTLTHGFWMGRYEVTQGEYRDVTGASPSYFAGSDSLPVEMVSWNDATNYCALLTQRERAAGRLPAGYVYRLPTEAEWEYAARAGSTNRFSYGADPTYSQLGGYAWYSANSGNTTHVVGTKTRNAWGLCDMAGNVNEWCADWYGPYLGGTATDPKGPASGTDRVFRGGSWGNSAEDCRVTARNGLDPAGALNNFGFRVVLALP